MGARPLLPHAHGAGTKPRQPQQVQLGFVSSSSAQMFDIPLAPARLAFPPIPKSCLRKLSTSTAEPTQPIALGRPRPPGDASGCSPARCTPAFPSNKSCPYLALHLLETGRRTLENPLAPPQVSLLGFATFCDKRKWEMPFNASQCIRGPVPNQAQCEK